MSSSRPTESRPTERVRTWLSGWSLRARLLVAMIGLFAVVCAVIGVVTDVAMYQIQVRQLDERLQAGAHHPPAALTPGSDELPGATGSARQQNRERFGPGGPPADSQLTAWIENGSVSVAAIHTGGADRTIPSSEYGVLTAVPVNGKPYTRTVSDSDYRLVAVRLPNGVVLVNGLPMKQVYTAQYSLALIDTGVGLVALVLAAMLGALIMRRTLRPLGRVVATARRVSELPLDRGEVALSVRVPDADPRTEVGQVGAALNRMLGHVAEALAARQTSETRVRHFVADASHELRTPLAAIRGYAELTRRFGNGVPPDVAHAMRRVESETARMTVLVEDMLLLARLDSGRPLATEPVDLSRLVIDAVSDAHVAGPDHHWQLDLPEESVAVDGDEARLHQVLANLLANGRTHTPPGTTVTTSVSVTRDAVLLTVADNGPGIPPDLLPEVFDRFARGDTSRSRAAGSTGLGLAIVAAVVEAHRGSVEVTSRPGHTAFTVRLPAKRTADAVAVGTGAPRPRTRGLTP
jgi:two-component system, OmpR family, sensor kinase